VATGWSGTNANTGNFAGTKIVKGLPIRGAGNSPAGLFWALDMLIRVSYIGGSALWKYDPVSANTTVLSKAAIVEYDGLYFWPGVDRFYVYNGVVNELPNDMNLNFFYDNLNPTQVAKVWALKVPRFGEIWWFFPSGSNTECDKAIIYNVRLGTWYDTTMARSAGASARVFPYPTMGGGEGQDTILLTYTAGVGVFNTGEVITGGTSGATGQIYRILTGQLNLINTSGTFVNGETVSNAGATATGTLTADPDTQEINVLWQHEYGYDRVVGASATAIDSYFETANFQFPTGGPAQNAAAGANVSTRMTKIEPDFISEGDLEVSVIGRPYAQGLLQEGPVKTFDETTEYVDFRDQRRLMALRVRSNVAGGFYEMGRPLIHVEPGDERAAG
jgi:hypothetical protein